MEYQEPIFMEELRMSYEEKKAKQRLSGLGSLLEKGVTMTYIFSIFCFVFAVFFTFRLFAESVAPPDIVMDEESSLKQEEKKDEAKYVPRTILSIYYDEQPDEMRYHPIHLFFDMPLHHLGLRVRHWNAARGLPPEEMMRNVRGILAYFDSNAMGDPQAFIEWSTKQVQSGKKYLLLGGLGFYQNKKKEKTPARLINNFISHLGLQLSSSSKSLTYDIEYLPYQEERIEFERKLTNDLASFTALNSLSPDLDVILSAKSPNENTLPSILVCLNKNGGFASSGYYLYQNKKGVAQWRVNPFEFFRKAFDTDSLPKMDTTTLAGRRIYYAHIDGDGWRSVSLIPGYKEKNKNCAQVVLEEIIQKYPQFPLTISPVAADLDPKYFGSQELMQQAKEIFAYPHISAGSHTYTHPLYWKFYEDEHAAIKEKKEFEDSKNKVEFMYDGQETTKVANRYALPRSYMYGDFDINKELMGSINFIANLVPKGKKVDLFQWSGDCIPFKAAISELRKNKIRNINGGDSRFDAEFPSYAFVSPVGKNEDGEWQVYASNSNENTYTNEWTDRYFGYRYLQTTFNHTEIPIRIKPANIYYHMYSAEKIASLRALLDNLNYVAQQEIIPISAKHYAAIGDAFDQADLVSLGDNSWQIVNKGAMSTLRFDKASLKSVDWEKSKGVIGQRHHQGSLYVYLDKRVPDHIVAIKDEECCASEPSKAKNPYIISSRWRIWNFDQSDQRISFIAQGFGSGEMALFMPKAGEYKISGNTSDGRVFSYKGVTDKQNVLRVTIKESAIDPLALHLTPQDNHSTGHTS